MQRGEFAIVFFGFSLLNHDLLNWKWFWAKWIVVNMQIKKKIPGNPNFENSPAAKKVSHQIRPKHNRILMEFEINPLRWKLLDEVQL